MTRFKIAFRSSFAYQKQPRQLLREVASITAVSFAARYIFQNPYIFLICYLVTADQSIDLIEKWMVRRGKVKHFNQWFTIECALLVIVIRLVNMSNRLLFPEARSSMIKIFILFLLIKRATVASELYQLHKYAR